MTPEYAAFKAWADPYERRIEALLPDVVWYAGIVETWPVKTLALVCEGELTADQMRAAAAVLDEAAAAWRAKA